MNDNSFWAHFHLMVNDVPILEFLLTALFFILALTSRWRDDWARAGMLTLTISMLGVLAAFLSGDPALDVIEGQPRTSAKAHSQHHVSGLIATVLAVITAIIATITFIRARKPEGLIPPGGL